MNSPSETRRRGWHLFASEKTPGEVTALRLDFRERLPRKKQEKFGWVGGP
jgi:hypothetical protein